MTKAEAIRNTEYTENDLINLALTMAVQQSREWRNRSEDSESWDHYEALLNAFMAIHEERMGNEATKH